MTRPQASASRPDWVAYARRLAVFTVAFNVLEGLVSMGFGWAGGSLSLFGFGGQDTRNRFCIGFFFGNFR